MSAVANVPVVNLDNANEDQRGVFRRFCDDYQAVFYSVNSSLATNLLLLIAACIGTCIGSSTDKTINNVYRVASTLIYFASALSFGNDVRMNFNNGKAPHGVNENALFRVVFHRIGASYLVVLLLICSSATNVLWTVEAQESTSAIRIGCFVLQFITLLVLIIDSVVNFFRPE